MTPRPPRTLLPLTALTLTLAMTGAGGCSSSVDAQYKPTAPIAQWSDAEWATVLNNVVDSRGLVKYDVLRNNTAGTRDALYRYVGQLGAASPENRPDLFPTADAKLAYWINAYNAVCLYRVVERGYPGNMIASVPPAAIYFTDRTTVGGKSYNLDGLEKSKVLSAGDPRVHFALNCASYSCPPLRNEPYTGPKLQAQLADQTNYYLKDPRAVTTVDADTVGLNGIFTDYYTGDFTSWYQRTTGRKGSLLDALKKLAPPDSPIQRASNIKGTGYDWDRNDSNRG